MNTRYKVGMANLVRRWFNTMSGVVAQNPRILVLFDIDGTLTASRKAAEGHMIDFLRTLRTRVTTGVVGGSDLAKAKEQLGDDYLEKFDYAFSENGLTAFHQGKSIGVTSLRDKYTEDQLKRIINFLLRYIADLDIPIKRGTFVEFRTGMLNVSPIGRNCNQEERDAFEAYDKIHGVRAAMVEAMRKEFADLDLTFSIGGQISIDIFPRGWDKTYCLRYLKPEDFDEIHFFGDKTFEGGNDYEIFTHERTIGHTTAGPADTITQLKAMFDL